MTDMKGRGNEQGIELSGREVGPGKEFHTVHTKASFVPGAVFRLRCGVFSKEPSRIETINDLDSNVTNLFDCIREDPEHLAAIVAATPYSREMYDRSFDGLVDDSHGQVPEGGCFPYLMLADTRIPGK